MEGTTTAKTALPPIPSIFFAHRSHKEKVDPACGVKRSLRQDDSDAAFPAFQRWA